MSSKTFNLSLPQELVQKLDSRARKDFSSRSDFVRKAVINQIRTEETLERILDGSNQKGTALGITSEQQVYDIILGK